MEENNIIVAKNVYKTFSGRLKTEALKNINLDIKKGVFYSLKGPSGSGKTTLLYLLGALDLPTKGKIIINNKDISKLNDKQLTVIRKKSIGFVFQFHFLLPEFSALENLIIPQLINNKDKSKASKKAMDLLEIVGIPNKKDNLPSQMSGGEQQRVAIARALVNDPLILLADEPTGNLDSENSNNIYNLFKSLNKELNQTILVVTHDENFASKSDKTIKIVDGEIISLDSNFV